MSKRDAQKFENRKLNNTKPKKPYNKRKGNKTSKSEFKPSSKGTTNGEVDVTQSSNDPKWYNQIPNLLHDTANLSYVSILGNSASVGDRTILGRRVVSENLSRPGIMSLEVLPTIGYGQTSDYKPIDIAATKLWAKFRQKMSGSTRNYDAPDLMIFTLCAADVLAAIKWLKRAYGVANQFYARNKFLPEAIIKAMGIEPSVIINNLAQFRADINNLVSQAKTICMPRELTYFDRTAFMYENVYVESKHVTDQIYVTKPAAFRMFYVDPDTGSAIKYVTPAASDPITTVRSMIAALLQSEDYGTAAGDFLRVYEDKGLLFEDYLEESYVTPMLVDSVFLEQIKNATVMPSWTITPVTSITIKQDPKTNCLTTNVFKEWTTSEVTNYYYPELVTYSLDKAIYTDAESMNPELMVELTRFVVGCDMFQEWTCGTEIITRVELYYFDQDNISSSSKGLVVKYIDPYLKFGDNTTQNSKTDDSNIIHWFRNRHMLNAFHYRPSQRVYDATNTTETQAKLLPDDRAVENFGMISNSDLRNIHEVALLNLFYLPN